MTLYMYDYISQFYNFHRKTILIDDIHEHDVRNNIFNMYVLR